MTSELIDPVAMTEIEPLKSGHIALVGGRNVGLIGVHFSQNTATPALNQEVLIHRLGMHVVRSSVHFTAIV